MFRFHRSIPTISIFYNSSAQSTQVLGLLRSALSSSYPPNSGRPLEFELSQVRDQPPTADQLRTILAYLKTPLTTLISAHPSISQPTLQQVDSPEALVDAAMRNPKVFRYPVVCNWEDGEAALDVGGVKKMLDSLAKKRDGGNSDDVEKPKGWFS